MTALLGLICRSFTRLSRGGSLCQRASDPFAQKTSEVCPIANIKTKIAPIWEEFDRVENRRRWEQREARCQSIQASPQISKLPSRTCLSLTREIAADSSALRRFNRRVSPKSSAGQTEMGSKHAPPCYRSSCHHSQS